MRARIQIAILCALALSPALAATRLRAIRARVDVAGPLVRLSDLAAAASGARLAVAPAPEPGAPAVWTRAEVRRKLAAAGLNPADFHIPAQVTVSRRAAPVTAVEVARALSAYWGRSVTAAQLSFTSPLTTVSGDPGIEVESAHYDAVRGWMVAQCRLRRDPALLPFTVLVASSGAVPAAASENKLTRALWLPPAPPLVRPGHEASLRIGNAGFAMVTGVMPLEAGAAGARIRATSLVTHAVLRVEVIGKDEVKLDAGR